MTTCLRAIGAITVTWLATAGLVAIGATQAAATTESTSQPASWAYVDSATPSTSFANQPGDLPVGSFTTANGKTHTARAFITFDLSSFQGTDVLSASFTDAETVVADCAKPRDTEVFRTASANGITWNRQPAELSQLPGPSVSSDCPATDGLTWDASQAVRDAIAAKATSVTFELRLPAGDEGDVDLGRRYDSQASLTVRDNRIPTQPTGLAVNGTTCGQTPLALNTLQVFLASFSTDGDDGFTALTYTYTYWPVDHPDQRTEVTATGGQNTVVLDSSTLVDGTTYAWQVQVSDGTDASPVSATCEFAVDFTAPPVAPTVTSTDYPATAKPNTHGGTGIPGTFTVKATGDPDVVGFDYTFGFNGPTFVAANRTGGSAKIQLTPTQAGSNDLSVIAVDAAGNQSPTTDYVFDVADNSPIVTCTPESAFIGTSRTCTFTPRATTAKGALPVVEYDYSDFRNEFSVAAGPDGSATVVVQPVQALGGNFGIGVSAKLSNGQLTQSTTFFFDVDLGFPQVTPQSATTLVNQPVTFTVHAVLPGSVTLTYGDTLGDQGTVPVDADGNAQITVTPTRSSSFANFFVHSTTADGQNSGTAGVSLVVLTNGPTVTSSDYPQFQFAGGLGQPGTFTFTSPVAGAQSFTYSVNGGQQTTVPADASGAASVRITPATTDSVLTVTSTLADGSTSEPARYEFFANPVAPNIDCTVSTVDLGDTFQCTFSPVQTDVASYTYQWSNEAPVTVPAGADGTATVTLTATDQDVDDPVVQVFSTDTEGIASGRDSTFVTINQNADAVPGRLSMHIV